MNDRAPAETDPYARFVRSLNGFVRVGYKLGTFVIVWVLADEAMVLKRTLTIRHEAATHGNVDRADHGSAGRFGWNVGIRRGE